MPLRSLAHEAKVLAPVQPGSAVSSESVSDILEKACEGFLTGQALEEARQKWAGKVVIFDTNVLLNDPYAIFKYPGAQIVIPGTVLEELDGKKEDLQTGKAAREFSRIIDRLLENGGNLRKGVKVGEHTTLKVDNRDLTHYLGETTLDRGKKDNEIVALALAYTYETESYGNVVLVTDDRNVRIKASSEEVVSKPFEYDWVTSATKIDPGYKTWKVEPDQFKRFVQDGIMPKPEDLSIRPNEFVMIGTGDVETCDDCLARYFYDREDPSKSGLRKVPRYDDIEVPVKNLEQRMLIDLELDPTVSLVVAEADAGTGKTWVTMTAGLMQMGNRKSHYGGHYTDLTITKPMITMGKGERMGALPGGANEKLKEKLNSFYDNLRVIVHKLGGGKGKPPSNGKAVNVQGLEVAVFPEIRGRSFHDTFFVIDEFQNTSVHEAKTILTRAAAGTKIIVIGNVEQIDDPYLNDRNNGLSVTATLFTQDALTDEERSLVGFVKLKEGVRSPISTLSIKLFSQPLPK